MGVLSIILIVTPEVPVPAGVRILVASSIVMLVHYPADGLATANARAAAAKSLVS